MTLAAHQPLVPVVLAIVARPTPVPAPQAPATSAVFQRMPGPAPVPLVNASKSYPHTTRGFVHLLRTYYIVNGLPDALREMTTSAWARDQWARPTMEGFARLRGLLRLVEELYPPSCDGGRLPDAVVERIGATIDDVAKRIAADRPDWAARFGHYATQLRRCHVRTCALDREIMSLDEASQRMIAAYDEPMGRRDIRGARRPRSRCAVA